VYHHQISFVPYNLELEESKKQSPGSKKKKQTQLSFAPKPGTSSQSKVKNIFIQKLDYFMRKESHLSQ
jgi:hypothetical protein